MDMRDLANSEVGQRMRLNAARQPEEVQAVVQANAEKLGGCEKPHDFAQLVGIDEAELPMNVPGIRCLKCGGLVPLAAAGAYQFAMNPEIPEDYALHVYHCWIVTGNRHAGR